MLAMNLLVSVGAMLSVATCASSEAGSTKQIRNVPQKSSTVISASVPS